MLPLPTAQFTLGAPLKLDAFSVGERRGDNYAVVTAGYLHMVSHLPDFLGGPVIVGARHSRILDWRGTRRFVVSFGRVFR